MKRRIFIIQNSRLNSHSSQPGDSSILAVADIRRGTFEHDFGHPVEESDRRSDAPSRRKHMFARTWRETTGNLIDRSFSITRRKREKRWNSWRELERERDVDEEQEGRSRHSRRRDEETLTNDNGRCNSSPSVTSVKSDGQPDRQRGREREKA